MKIGIKVLLIMFSVQFWFSNDIGGNRVSMNVTILGYQDYIELIAITAGGSQATFFKVNTWGEEAFLDKIIDPVEEYIKKNKRR